MVLHLLKFKRILRLFLIGAIGYTLLEIIWRGHTHWTMSLTGGVCFILIYFIWRRLRFAPWYRICLCCAAAVTGVEFAFGVECMELRADAAASVRPDLPSVQYTLVFPFRAFAALVPPAQEKGNLLKKAHLV